MARIDDDILKQAGYDDGFNYDYEEVISWSDAAGEVKLTPAEQEVYEYIKKRVESIAGYPAKFLQQKSMERLIQTICRRKGYTSIEDINDQIIRDLLEELKEVESAEEHSAAPVNNRGKK